MKLSDMHADRISALGGVESLLADVYGTDSAQFVVQKAQELAILLIRLAPETDDPGRLTHAIDCIRTALDAAVAASDIGSAKKRRLTGATAVAVAAAADAEESKAKPST